MVDGLVLAFSSGSVLALFLLLAIIYVFFNPKPDTGRNQQGGAAIQWDSRRRIQLSHSRD